MRKLGIIFTCLMLTTSAFSGCFFAESTENARLYEAIERNDLSVVEDVINDGQVSINGPCHCFNPHETTPLTYACRLKRIEIVEFLLSKGANASRLDPSGITPLIYTITNRHGDTLGIVKLLLQHGADTEGTELGEARKPIHHAVKNPADTQVLQCLIEYGANVDATDLNTNTPLLLAIRNKNLDAVKILIEAGADINKRTLWMETPLITAIKCRNLESFKLLVDAGADVTCRNYEGQSLLDLASIDSEFIDYLLQKRS